MAIPQHVWKLILYYEFENYTFHTTNTSPKGQWVKSNLLPNSDIPQKYNHLFPCLYGIGFSFIWCIRANLGVMLRVTVVFIGAFYPNNRLILRPQLSYSSNIYILHTMSTHGHTMATTRRHGGSSTREICPTIQSFHISLQGVYGIIVNSGWNNVHAQCTCRQIQEFQVTKEINISFKYHPWMTLLYVLCGCTSWEE